MAAQSLSVTGRSRKIRVWDLPLRLFHWLLVAVIALAFLSSEEGGSLSNWHIASGWMAAVLIAFRIVWGLVGGEHSRWSDFVRPSGLADHFRDLVRLRPAPTLGHNPLGALSVLALLALAATVVWTGTALGDVGEGLHELLAWTLLALVALHIFAVLVMSLLCRENLVGAMITGRKPVEPHPDAHDARRPPWYGFILAALAVAGAIQGVRSVDPLAFTPRSPEAFERGGEAGRTDGAAHETEAGEHSGDEGG